LAQNEGHFNKKNGGLQEAVFLHKEVMRAIDGP
jgi:hypothetical protein